MTSKKEAMRAVDTIVRYIEGLEGDLREGLAKTPKRVVESFDEIFSGYGEDAKSILDSTFNAEGYEGIVLLKDVEFHSTCEHHLQPFSGKGHIAYIPVERIVGISKLARLLDMHSKRLQNQERITQSVADDIVVTAKSGFGGTFDALDLSIGGQYFMGDYYVGLDVDDPINNLDLGLNAGRYIDFKDVLYIAPQLNIGTLLNDPAVTMSINLGARF